MRLTNNEKLEWLENDSLGYWSALGGLELKEILYGIDDNAIVVSNAWSSSKSVHCLRVHYDSKDSRPYIKLRGTRYYFDECLRM